MSSESDNNKVPVDEAEHLSRLKFMIADIGVMVMATSMSPEERLRHIKTILGETLKFEEQPGGSMQTPEKPRELFCRHFREKGGRLVPFETKDLFVWAVVNTRTLEVDMSSIRHHDDELTPLADGWDWRRFRLVETDERLAKQEHGK